MQVPPNLKTDDAIARYWNSTVTRGEVQSVFDDFTQFSVKMKEQQLKLDFAVAYICEKLQVTPEEVKEFMDRKIMEFAEAQKVKDAAEEKSTSVVLQ